MCNRYKAEATNYIAEDDVWRFRNAIISANTKHEAMLIIKDLERLVVKNVQEEMDNESKDV